MAKKIDLKDMKGLEIIAEFFKFLNVTGTGTRGDLPVEIAVVLLNRSLSGSWGGVDLKHGHALKVESWESFEKVLKQYI